MRHLNLSKSWQYSAEPFPALRCEIKLGARRNGKTDFAFVPVIDLVPTPRYTVYHYNGTHYEYFYDGYDQDRAHQVKEGRSLLGQHSMMETRLPELPEGKFRVIKTKAKGTTMIVPGSDYSDRLLLTIDFDPVYRGNIHLTHASASQFVAECRAVCAGGQRMSVMRIMDIGGWFAVEIANRRGTFYKKYTWDHDAERPGRQRLSWETFPKDKWNPPEDTCLWHWVVPRKTVLA